jgi:hypothetical protein
LEIIAKKPSILAQSHNGYFVNGYKFHTQKYGKGLVTSNCGVCVRGETYNSEESDYYGLVDEVLELQYDCNEHQTVVLFKCTWFDNKDGVVVHKNKLVDVKPTSRLQSDDPFILASQAEQVFYTPYPAMTSDTKNVWAVVKTKARHIYEVSATEAEVSNDVNTEAHVFFQINERFQLPDKVTRSERLDRVINTSTEDQMTDRAEEHEDDDDDDVDIDDTDDDDDDDDDDEMDHSEHSLDEDEHDC